MRDMTDEEYDALDEELTNNPLEIDRTSTKKGFFSREGFRAVFIDNDTAEILYMKALASRQTPGEVIATMLQKELAGITQG